MNCSFENFRQSVIQETPVLSSLCLRKYLKFIENSPVVIDQQPPEKLTAGAYYYICAVLTVMLISLIGTSITVYGYWNKSSKDKNNANYTKKKEMERLEGSTDKDVTFKSIFECFCIYSNGKKLFTASTTASPFNCLHGLRSLITLGVLTSHFIGFISLKISDFRNIQPILNAWYAQFLWNGFFMITEFFVIGGFLNAYFFCSEYAKTKGKISYFLLYTHRLIRMIPAYMAVYWFYTLLLSYLGSGPLWPSFDTNPLCLQRWWTYPLFTNNWDSVLNTCLAWFWYLATDMQLYVISPLFLIALMRWPKFGYFLIGTAICISSLFSSIMTYRFDLVLGMSRVTENLSNLEFYIERFLEFVDILYSKPITQLTPYFIGFLLGHYWYKRESIKSGKVSKMTQCCGWILSCFLVWVYFFGLYGTKNDPWVNAIFNGIKDVLFSISFAWFLLMCISGHTGILNRFLSWKGFQVPSRLGFCVYLTHTMVLSRLFFSTRKFLEPELMSLLVPLGYFVTISYVSAIFVCLLFEAPMVRLVSLYRQRKSTSLEKTD